MTLVAALDGALTNSPLPLVTHETVAPGPLPARPSLGPIPIPHLGDGTESNYPNWGRTLTLRWG